MLAALLRPEASVLFKALGEKDWALEGERREWVEAGVPSNP